MKVYLKTARQDGTEAATTRLIEGVRISIGRGSDQDIAVNDIRVPLQLAEISQRKDGFWISSKTADPLWVDGLSLTEAPLTEGRCIELGRFQLQVDSKQPDGLQLTLSARFSTAEATAQQREKYRLNLSDSKPRLRLWSYALLLVVLSTALIWPLAERMSRNKTPVEGSALAVAESHGAGMDQWWLSGPLSTAHRHFGNDCRQCHSALFSPVGEVQCLRCHEQLATHGNPAQISVSGSVTAPCTDCHLEHQRDEQVRIRDARLCLDCHQRAIGEAPEAQHFARAHPELLQNAPATQGVLFNHALHLDADGLRAAEGIESLSCGSCHLEDTGGGFQAVNFEAHCERCHSVDASLEGQLKQLPHGAIADLQRNLQGAFARLALNAATDRQLDTRRPVGALTAPQREAALVWAQRESERELADLVLRRSCVVCHDVSQPDGELQLAPVALPDQFFRSARFDHQAHATQSCGSCHQDVSHSSEAADQLLPSREQCVACHGGDDQRGGGLANCQTCHDFHNTHLPWSMHEAVH